MMVISRFVMTLTRALDAAAGAFSNRVSASTATVIAALSLGCLSGVAQAATSTALGPTGTSSNPSGGSTATVNQTTMQTVNTATGNTYVKFSDLVPIGEGLHFAFIRSYNDQDSYSGPLCIGWTHSYNILLSVGVSGAVTVKEGDGHSDVFQPGTMGTYTAPPGDYDVLMNTGTNMYTLTRPDQTVLAFGPIPLNPVIIRLLSITDKNGNTQLLSYDSNGNLIRFTDVGGGIYTFTYDAMNHLTSLHDGTLNRTLSYASDVAGTTLTSYTDAAGDVSTYTYNSLNLLIGATDPRTNTAISNTFDSQGRVVQTTRGTCATTYFYDDVNNITTITDPYGDVTKHYYDTSTPQRLIKIVNALAYQMTFTYDTNNNVTSMTNSLGQITNYAYDSHGNRTSVTDPLNHVTTYAYDNVNDLTSTTDADGNTTTYSYDTHGNLIKVTDALSGVTTFSYDSKGNKTKFTNANGKPTTYTYDAGNHLLTTTDPLANTTSMTYDAFGRLTRQTEPAGNVKTITYDNLNHILSISYTQGSLASLAGPVSYTYDANGNRLSMMDSAGTTSYTYDALDRVTAINFPGGRTVTYSYDCNNNRTSMTYAGKTVSFTYDAINRMISVHDGSQVTTYTYDAADNLLGIAYPNGASVGYSYDGASRMVQVQNAYTGSSSPPSPISSFTYVLDNVGNRTQVTDGAGKVSTYAYDNLYRIISATVGLKTTTYTYDAVGNRLTLTAPATSLTYSYDSADRLIAAGSTPFVYDLNGNPVSKGSGSSKITYAYDSADRLTGESGGGLPTSDFSYDGDGNRVTQAVGTGIYSYLNDIATGFTTVLNETGPDGNISYVRGRGLISADGPNFTYYYHYDAESTVVGLTAKTGHLAQRYVYDVWGNRSLTVPGPQVGTQNKFGYIGEARDPGTGLTYLRARYYDPTVGRFISKDPLAGFDRTPLTLNRFIYARDNPATLTDRTGY